MNEDDVDDGLKRLWGEDKDQYVLERKDNIFGYSIMNVLYNSTVIIEVDDMALYVIQKMLENGVRIVDDFEQVRNPNPLKPIFFTPELHEKWMAQLEERKKNKRK